MYNYPITIEKLCKLSIEIANQYECHPEQSEGSKTLKEYF